MKDYICNHKKEPCTKKVPLFAELSDVGNVKNSQNDESHPLPKGANGDTRRSKIRYSIHNE